MTAVSATSQLSSALDRVLAAGLVRSVYQPIVDLRSHEVVAFEALARGAAGSGLESPADLFGAARAHGRLAELDWLCVRAAIEGARGGLSPGQWLFVNIEPEVVAEPPPEVSALLATLPPTLQVVVELTERALTERPAELLRLVRRVRARGWAVALDDVGADPRSLALMPLLEPDVIKLDLSLVQQRPTAAVAEIVSAVSAYTERSGAQILAEGIETDAHEHAALAMGARYGQGWRLGRPGTLPYPTPELTTPLTIGRRHDEPMRSAYEAVLVTGSHQLRSTKSLLIEMSKHTWRNRPVDWGRRPCYSPRSNTSGMSPPGPRPDTRSLLRTWRSWGPLARRCRRLPCPEFAGYGSTVTTPS